MSQFSFSRCWVVVFILVPLWSQGTIHAQTEFYKHNVSLVFEGAHAVQAVDLDRDGDRDVVGASGDAIILWRNVEGNQTVWKADTVANAFGGARFVDVEDIDGDGDLDLHGAARSIDAIKWWENLNGDATSWKEHVVDDSFDFAIHTFAIDLDRDEDLDILGAALKDDAISWWENTTGDGTSWIKHTLDSTFSGARHVCVTDIDDDGDYDVVGSADLADTIAWWENVGTADSLSWVKHVIDSTFNGINSVHPGDFNRDDYPDLLGIADDADEIAWWQNIPGDTVTWTKIVIDGDFDGAVSGQPVDLDADGDKDVIGAAAFENKVSWWENASGDGLVWKEHSIDSAFDFPSYIVAADMDGDGDKDVLGSNLTTSELLQGEIVWWENEVALPVELGSFDGYVQNSTAYLAWNTFSETNNAGFEVQHLANLGVRHASEGRVDWQGVFFVPGAGTTLEAQSYTARIDGLQPGGHRFRLKQIDFDGTFSISPTIELQVLVGQSHRVTPPFPNPFNPQTQFSVAVATSQYVSIDVFNTLGQRVIQIHEGELSAHEDYRFNFDADSLPGGLYVIRVRGEQFASTRPAMLVK